MATFVLVHGAWHGGWCWSRVTPQLQALGHQVFAPTLSGLANRSHLLSPTINLQTHIRDITGLLQWEDLRDVILVGHSYGGMVIAGVADAMVERVSALAVIDGYVPENGDSAFSHRPADRNAETLAMVRAQGMGWQIPPYSAASFGVNAADQAWVDSKLTPQPLACFSQPIRLTGDSDKITRKLYLRAGDYPNAHFSALADKLTADPGWQVTEMACGHDIMVDQPAALAAALATLA